MRKILSEEELLARQSKRNKWISILILVMMVFGTAGAAFVYNSETKQPGSGNSKVTQNGGRWFAEFSGTTLSFLTSPESALNNTKISIIPDFNRFYQQPLYIDTNDSLAYGEIYSSLGLFSQRTQQACYQECENSDLVQKDCTNNLIVFKPSENKSIAENQSCIFIQGDLSTVDAFLYRTFGLA